MKVLLLAQVSVAGLSSGGFGDRSEGKCMLQSKVRQTPFLSQPYLLAMTVLSEPCLLICGKGVMHTLPDC